MHKLSNSFRCLILCLIFIQNWTFNEHFFFARFTILMSISTQLKIWKQSMWHKAGTCPQTDLMKSNNVSLTSVWNLLSHKYRDVLMGLNGSKSMLTFFSFPSSVTMVPQYITKPLGGTTTIQTQIKSKTLQMIQIKHLKHILKYWHNL